MAKRSAKLAYLLILTLVVTGLANRASAMTIVNLDAQVAHGFANAEVITLGPGTYNVEAIAGVHTAWKPTAGPASGCVGDICTDGWFNQYGIDIGNDGSLEIAFPQGPQYATDLLALANASKASFTLTQTTDVAFLLGFDAQLADNQGGLSLAVSAIPEPAGALLFAAGFAVAGLRIRRRRSS